MSTPANASTSSNIRRRKKCQSFKVISYIVEILKEHYTENKSSKEASPSVEMSQFSSAGQIVGLFTFATIVSIALIFLTNAEVESRTDHLAPEQQWQIRQIQVQGSSSVDVSSNNRNDNPDSASTQQRGSPLSTNYEPDSSKSSSEPLSEDPQLNYQRQASARVQVPSENADGVGPLEESKAAAYTARIPSHANNVKNKKPTSAAATKTAERTNFLTYFGSQIIKLFTSVNSNINLVHLGKFEDDEHQVAVPATGTVTRAHKSSSGAGTNVNAISSSSHANSHAHAEESPTFESHRMKRAAAGANTGSVNGGDRRESERRAIPSTFSAGNVMDGNNNNVKNENFVLSSTFNDGGDGAANTGGNEQQYYEPTSNNHNVRNSNGNGNNNGRNYAGVIGSPGKLPGGSGSGPGPGMTSVTSDFHKIRHAMKKLENDGGLEGDVVLRMMLGPNAKIVEARQPPPPPQQHQHPISVPFPAVAVSAPTMSTTTTAATRRIDAEDGDGDDVFINFREKLTSFRNKNTIDWKSYADEDEIDNDDEDEDEGDNDEEEEAGEGRAAAEIDEAATGKSIMNWSDEEPSSNTGTRTANEDGKDPSSPSSFIFRAVVPGERKHSRNYYTDGGDHYGHGPSHSNTNTNTNSHGHTRARAKSDTVKIVKVSVPNSFSVDDLNNINDSDENRDEDGEEVDDNIFLASPNNRIVNTSVDTNPNLQQKGNGNGNGSSAGGGGFGLSHSHATPTTTATKKSIIKEGIDTICYKTDDVLIVIAITCCLNFAFVLIIWTSVKWFSLATGTGSKEKQFQHLECEDGLTEPVADLFRDDTADRDPDDPLLYDWQPAARKYANAHRSGSSRSAAGSGRKSLYHDYSRGTGVSCTGIGASYGYGYGGGGGGVHRRTTTSMYSFRPAESCGTWTGIGTGTLHNQQMRRSYSYSMEDLRFYNCST